MSDSSQTSGPPITTAVVSALAVVGFTALLRRGWRWLLEAQPPKSLTRPSCLAECMQRMSKFCKASPTFDGLLADFDFESCKPDPVTLHGSILPGKYLLREGEVVDEGAVALLLDSLTGQVNYFAGNEGYVSGEMNIEWFVQASAGERLIVKAWIEQLPKAVKAERRAAGERETAILGFELSRSPRADENGSESILVARGTQMQLCILTPWQRRKASLTWYVPGMRTYRWQSFVQQLVTMAPNLRPLSSLGLMPELLGLKPEKAEKPGQSCFSAVITPRLLNVGGVAHGAATCGLFAAAVRRHCASELQEAQRAAAAEGRELEAADCGNPVRRMQIFFMQPVPANGTVKILVSEPPNSGNTSNAARERVVNAVMKGQDGGFLARSRVTVPKLPEKKPLPPPLPRPAAPLMAGGLSRMPIGMSRLGGGVSRLGGGLMPRPMPRPGAGRNGDEKRAPSSSEEDAEDDDTDSAEDRLERLQRLRAKLEGLDDEPAVKTQKNHVNEAQKEKQREADDGDVEQPVAGKADAADVEQPLASKADAADVEQPGAGKADAADVAQPDASTADAADVEQPGASNANAGFADVEQPAVCAADAADVEQAGARKTEAAEANEAEASKADAAGTAKPAASDNGREAGAKDAVVEPPGASKEDGDRPVASNDQQTDAVEVVESAENSVPTELEGCWCTNAGEPIAKIKGSMIHWSDSGDKSMIKNLGGKSWSMELDDETHCGELQTDGRLVWNDGEIWIPEGFQHVPEAKEEKQRDADVADDDAPMASSENVSDSPPNGSPLDGEWSTPDGEPIATIKDGKIFWAGDEGETSALTRLDDNAWSMELDDETHRGELEPDGRLMWSDGEIWVSVQPA